MEWIKCTDELPPGIEDEYNEVILYHPFKKVDGTPNHIIYVGYWDDLNEVWRCGWNSMFPPYSGSLICAVDNFIMTHFELDKDQVTHWMPLPNPPEE
jgi:hypothetical protein